MVRQLRPYLVNRGGLLGFYHVNVGMAVRRRYLESVEAQKKAHSQLAVYFASQPLGTRKVEELPWLYSQASDLNQLANLLQRTWSSSRKHAE